MSESDFLTMEREIDTIFRIGLVCTEYAGH